MCGRVFPGLRPVAKRVQRQVGGDDCGLFAVAFAEAVCRGDDPELLRFDQGKMRQHLEQCFVSGIMTAFPLLARAEQEQKQ